MDREIRVNAPWLTTLSLAALVGWGPLLLDDGAQPRDSGVEASTRASAARAGALSGVPLYAPVCWLADDRSEGDTLGGKAMVTAVAHAIRPPDSVWTQAPPSTVSLRAVRPLYRIAPKASPPRPPFPALLG